MKRVDRIPAFVAPAVPHQFEFQFQFFGAGIGGKNDGQHPVDPVIHQPEELTFYPFGEFHLVQIIHEQQFGFA